MSALPLKADMRDAKTNSALGQKRTLREIRAPGRTVSIKDECARSAKFQSFVQWRGI
jgi:hypothetical protein